VLSLPNSADGTPAPIVVTKEVDMTVAGSFVLDKSNFLKTEVVKVKVYTIIAHVIDSRMKEVRIFNPLHVLGNKISVSDIHGLKILKL
jgi:hypothetical protein